MVSGRFKGIQRVPGGLKGKLQVPGGLRGVAAGFSGFQKGTLRALKDAAGDTRGISEDPRGSMRSQRHQGTSWSMLRVSGRLQGAPEGSSGLQRVSEHFMRSQDVLRMLQRRFRGHHKVSRP